MPPHKWVDNAELSVPDQMTNITEKTRPQSYLQLSGRRPNTQDQFNTLGLKLASEYVCVCAWVCVCVRDCSMFPKPSRPSKPERHTGQRQQYIHKYIYPASVIEVCMEEDGDSQLTGNMCNTVGELLLS